MQLNFWLLPDIFFLYLSTKLLPHHVLEGRDGSNIPPIPLSKNPDRNAMRALRTGVPDL